MSTPRTLGVKVPAAGEDARSPQPASSAPTTNTHATNDAVACQADRLPSNDITLIIARLRRALDRNADCRHGGRGRSS